ncbi:MAG TPA: M23 family metallopeptidase [Thermoanaerobaculia bacterium]|nr:M23 family metallopeptidase [Thermoanaerobaculia bacterium]
MVREKKAAGCLVRAVLGGALLVLFLLGITTFWVGSAPELTVKPGAKGIGRRTPIAIHLDDTGRTEKLRVELIQGQDVTPVAEKEFATHPAWAFWQRRRPADVNVEVGRDTVKGLRAGEATVRVTAERAGSLLRRPDPVVAEVKLPVRLAPPSLGLVSTQHYVAQGGCEVVVYRVGESAVADGVRSGEWWFPGFPMPGPDKQLRFAFYAVPWDTGDASAVRLSATDEVGNEATVGFVDQFFPKPIKVDTIQITDAFLNKVVPEILGQSPEIRDQGDLVKNFLTINGELRKKDGEFLKGLAAKSAHEFLWKEPFLPMPNAKITAAFAQRRTYVYQGRQIDQQTHLGFDMASVQRDAVPASNAGTVVLARFFGIYGNAVVIDHGYGLMSLYGHLSSIAVKEGQHVERSQELGRSGQTGLAGGDHLHFTMLLGGLPINPVEWWDPHWIRDRIARKLGPALKYAG